MHTQCSITFNLFRKIIVNLELNCQVQSYNTDIFRHIKVSQKNIISHSLLLHFKEREMCCNIHLYLSFLPSSNMKMDSNKTGLKTKKTCIFSKWQPKPQSNEEKFKTSSCAANSGGTRLRTEKEDRRIWGQKGDFTQYIQ